MLSIAHCCLLYRLKCEGWHRAVHFFAIPDHHSALMDTPFSYYKEKKERKLLCGGLSCLIALLVGPPASGFVQRTDELASIPTMGLRDEL